MIKFHYPTVHPEDTGAYVYVHLYIVHLSAEGHKSSQKCHNTLQTLKINFTYFFLLLFPHVVLQVPQSPQHPLEAGQGNG